MPWLVGLAFAATVGVVAVMRFRQIRNLRSRIKDLSLIHI